VWQGAQVSCLNVDQRPPDADPCSVIHLARARPPSHEARTRPGSLTGSICGTMCATRSNRRRLHRAPRNCIYLAKCSGSYRASSCAATSATSDREVSACCSPCRLLASRPPHGGRLHAAVVRKCEQYKASPDARWHPIQRKVWVARYRVAAWRDE
jgi:hypothetical protein